MLLWSADPRTRGRLERRRRGRPAAAVLADGRHHQPGREQAGPVPVRERLLCSSPARRNQTDGSLTMTFSNQHAAGSVPLHRRPLPGSRHRLRRIRRDRHRQPPGLRAATSRRRRTAPSSPAVPRGRPSWRVPPSTSSKERRSSITFNFVLPEAHGSMTVVPSARSFAWHVATHRGADAASWHVTGSRRKHSSWSQDRTPATTPSCAAVATLPVDGGRADRPSGRRLHPRSAENAARLLGNEPPVIWELTPPLSL